ncbi:MAG: anti-sigma factor family protein [Cyclobacteriaceae bacterium]
MALEHDLQVLDDYLANRLTEQEKVAFEQKLKTDPNLQQEVKFQQQLIEGIRQARVTELKAMLNAVPVSPVNVGTSSIAAKLVSTIAVVGVISTVLYFYLNEGDSSKTTPSEELVVNQVIEDKKTESQEKAIEEIPAEDNKTEGEVKPVEKETVPVAKPQLEVFTPETEAEQLQAQKEHAQLDIIARAFVTSSIEVDTEEGTRKYGFHYMFKDNKLVLFGSFENNLYEILEFIAGDQRTVFLFYNDAYYLLDLDKTVPTQLVPIKDKTLLNKLKQYRGN